MTEPYSYNPLSSDDSIRILELQPARHHIDPICISLREINLRPHRSGSKKRVDYEALSYVWGAKRGDRPIICENRKLSVTPNCESALRHLRRKRHTRILWVDAICINQESEDDKTRQVRRMGDIYYYAAEVVVWLGDVIPGTTEAFRYLRRLAMTTPSRQQKPSSGAKLLKWLDMLPRGRIPDLPEEAKFQKPDETCLRAMLFLPYFERMWTIQELAVSRKAVVICGTKSIDWILFAKGALNFMKENYLPPYGGLQSANQIGFYGHFICAGIIRGPEKSQGVDRGNAVRMLLATAHGHHASDARDKVFALRNLCLYIGIHLPEPDYKKMDLEVYREATLALIKQTKSLCIFDVTWGDLSSPDPSWVHSFHFAAKTSAVRIWHVAGDSLVNTTDMSSEDSSKLCLEGSRFNTVARIGAMEPIEREFIQGRTNADASRMVSQGSGLRDWCDMIQKYDRDTYPSTEELPIHALFHTVTAVMDDWDMPESQLWDDFKVIYDTVQAAREKPPPPEMIQQFLARGLDGRYFANDSNMLFLISLFLRFNLTDPTNLLYLLARTSWAFQGERFFITEDGHFGIGPGDMQPDDIIVIFAGASMPSVLRANGPHFRLVGPAFIHGIMEGEAWTEDQSKSLEKYTLV